MKRSFLRSLKATATAAATAGLLALGAAAASAHVNVAPDDPAAGGYTHLTFSVPNESPSAKTSRLEVKLPTETPFTAVSVKPIDGWTEQVNTSDLPKPVTINGSTVTKAVSSVVWTADAAHQLGQNQYQTFSLSVGTLPAAGTTITLPAAQSYTDGSVVNWNEQTVDGQPEPQHPAPSFVTTAQDGTATASATPAVPAPPAAGAAASISGNGSAAGWFGLAAGILGLIAGVIALVRTQRLSPAK